jgi:hypothetical protein
VVVAFAPREHKLHLGFQLLEINQLRYKQHDPQKFLRADQPEQPRHINHLRMRRFLHVLPYLVLLSLNDKKKYNEDEKKNRYRKSDAPEIPPGV